MKLYQTIALAAIVGLTVASGVMQGRMTNRWGLEPEALAAGKKLEEVPAEFGSWKLVAKQEMDEQSRKMLETFGEAGGMYENIETGARVSVFVIVGPPGPVALHVPEICMSCRENTLLGPRKDFTIEEKNNPGKAHHFWGVRFKRTDVDGTLIPVYYAWTIDGTWAAEEGGHWGHGGDPYLYKIQVQCWLPAMAGAVETDPAQEFLAEFVPALAPYLVPPQGR